MLGHDAGASCLNGAGRCSDYHVLSTQSDNAAEWCLGPSSDPEAHKFAIRNDSVFIHAFRRIRLKGSDLKEKTMSVTGELKRRVRSMIAPSIFLAITAYFAWNATQGDRGLVATAERQNLLHQVTDELTKAKAERDALQIRVNGLQNRHLDPDTLNEQARVMLDMGDPADVVVKLSSKDRLY
jgi:cell division protein FtsB